MKQIKISDLKLLEVLNRVPFFQQFTVNERKVFFASNLTFLQCLQDEDIIKQGEDPSGFYFILSGSATVSINFKRDDVATVKAGYFIGEGAFVMNRPHTATVTSNGETFVVRMNHDILRSFPVSVREKLKDQIINGMAMRLSDMNRQLLDKGCT
jgi:CRP/FNR family cyclic AMP-dependent transcriptional regulator